MSDDGEDMVLLSSAARSSPETYHRDRECQYIQQSNNVVERSLASLRGRCDPCPVCADDEDVMVIVSTSAGHRGNTTFHRDEDCPSVQKMSTTTRKPLPALAGHYDPCGRCHDIVIISATRYRRRYHRSADCYYVKTSSRVGSVPLSLLDDEGPCSLCAIEDTDESECDSIEVCPECDESNIQPVTGSVDMEPRDHDYLCKVCKARFSRPDTRPRKTSKSSNRSGLAGKLMQADPDDVSAEHVDGEPMTDGGVVRWG